MLKRFYSFALVLLCSLMTAWADSQTITVKDQPTVNGGTAAYADDSKTVATTNANNAIWYLCDVDMAQLKSIEVKGAAFVSAVINEVETMPELKIAFMPVGDETTVDTDYMSTNSGTIRGASRLLAKIVANTVPTTMADGKTAVNYPGADFLVTSTVAQTGTYDGTVTMGECTGITKTSEKVHLFVYGTAQSRRLAIDQIVVNTKAENPVYNKTTGEYFADLNKAFAALTDADTELEVSDNVKLTGRLTWSKAHTLTITPTADITITASGTNYMWFLANVNNAVLNVGSSDYTITLEGDNKQYGIDVTKYENSSTISLANVVFQNFDLKNAGHLVGSKAQEGQIVLDKVTFKSCKNPANAFIDKQRVTNDRLVLKGYLNQEDCTGTTVYAASETKTSGTTGRIKIDDNEFTANSPITIEWPGTKAEGIVVVIGSKAANADKFVLTDEEWTLTRNPNNGDLIMTKPAEPTVKIGDKTYADLAAALAAAVDGDVITLLDDQEVSSRINVKNMALTITGGKAIKRAASYKGIMFLTVKPDDGEKAATLTLDGVTIDGQNVEATSPFSEASNQGLTVLKNVTVQNCINTNGAVLVNKSNGELVLDGVTFTNCSENQGMVFVGTNGVTLKGNNSISSIYVEKNLVLKADNASAAAAIKLITDDSRTYGLLVENGTATQFTSESFRLSQQTNGVYTMPKAVAASYSHPALLHTAADVEAIKGRLTTDDLTKTAYNHLKDAGTAASYTASPVEVLKRMDQANWSETYPDYNNYVNAANDAQAAYQLALRYQLGGEDNCAQAAVKILNDWAATNKGMLRLRSDAGHAAFANNIPDPNEYLMTIQAYQFANAAELLRSYTGWQAADQEKFQTWIKQTFADVAVEYLNTVEDQHRWLNWDLAALNALVSIGVLTDDKALVDFALNYVENGKGTGNKENAVAATHSDPDSEETLAQCQESGRDQGHSTLDITLLGVLCQTAQNANIGADLFTAYKALEMAEYVGKYNLKTQTGDYVYTETQVPFTSYNNGEVTHSVISADARGAERPCWELFHAYAKKNSKADAYTEAWVKYYREKYAWGEAAATGSDELGFGTLMFSSPSDISTAITTIKGDAAGMENGNVYNLNGQRVENPGKGLYIVNGKKVVR